MKLKEGSVEGRKKEGNDRGKRQRWRMKEKRKGKRKDV